MAETQNPIESEAEPAGPSGSEAGPVQSSNRAGMWIVIFMMLIFVSVVFQTCAAPGNQNAFRIVAGSGFASFEPILQRWARENNTTLDITYKGSLDIMLMLEDGSMKADAIWEGDSLWTSLGDKQHIVKNSQSIMCSPIVFGIKKSLAQQFGWIGRDVHMQDILTASESRRLRVLMTSASQSNTGASAYFGFFYAFAGQPDVLTDDHLSDRAVTGKVKRILNTVDRTSESSGWMRDLFLAHYADYDAMFNYESHVLEMNQKLVDRGDEPLYIIYPVEGLGMADFPFSYVQGDDPAKLKLFKSLQDYLRSEPVQREIAAKGRRVGALCDQVDPAIFRPEWGAYAGRTITSFKYPAEAVIRHALDLYQTDFRKPSYTVYALDFSGSMSGDGEKQLEQAMRLLLDQQEAKKYLLQAAPHDVTIVIAFNHGIINNAGWRVAGNDPVELNRLLRDIQGLGPGGNTNIYLPVARAFELMAGDDIGGRLPAVILMTDGQSNQGSLDQVKTALAATEVTGVPVYGITFGSADATQLQAIADLTQGRVFDGTKDLVGAFRKAKGQN